MLKTQRIRILRVARIFSSLLMIGLLCVQSIDQSWAGEVGAVVLPRADEGIAGQRIGWEDDIVAALHSAVVDHKPIVALIIRSRCGWCRVFVTHTWRCPAINSLAGKAHFVLLVDDFEAQPSEKNAVMKQIIERSTKLTGYPTTSILTVSAEKVVTPKIKIAGMMGENKLLDALRGVGLSPTKSTSVSAAVGSPLPKSCGDGDVHSDVDGDVDSEILKTLPPAIQYGINR